MHRAAAFAALYLAAAALPASVQHEVFRRSVTVSNASARQAYLAVPADIFLQSRADLGDLRLVRDGSEVSYFTRTEDASAGGPVAMKSRLLNLGTSGRGAHFTVEVDDAERAKSPYNRLTIELAKGAPDFIATVNISGSDESAGAAVDLGTHRIFKLEHENVPAHTGIELGPSTFRYLHVAVEGPLAVRNIRDVTVEANAAHGAEWSNVDASPAVETQGRTTTVSFLTSNRYPVAAMQFFVERSQQNFERNVKIFADDAQIGSFTLRRTTMKSTGESLDSDDGRAIFPAIGANRYRAEIENGDDPPLQISGAKLQLVQRRIYFAPDGSSQMVLYYGDGKAAPPVYEYGRLTQADAGASIATAGPEEHNPDFQPRPDTRPWTEKHQLLLKAALALVVAVMGSIALLSIKPRWG